MYQHVDLLYLFIYLFLDVDCLLVSDLEPSSELASVLCGWSLLGFKPLGWPSNPLAGPQTTQLGPQISLASPQTPWVIGLAPKHHGLASRQAVGLELRLTFRLILNTPWAGP